MSAQQLNLFAHVALPPRFWSKVNKTETCWLWKASRNRRGYGKFKVGKATRWAHHVAYEAFCGPIPEGLVIDHLCDVHACVCPDHLEAVTQAENLRRARERAGPRLLKTHCRHGHSMADACLDKKGRRHCRECGRLRRKACHAKELAKDPAGTRKKNAARRRKYYAQHREKISAQRKARRQFKAQAQKAAQGKGLLGRDSFPSPQGKQLFQAAWWSALEVQPKLPAIEAGEGREAPCTRPHETLLVNAQ